MNRRETQVTGADLVLQFLNSVGNRKESELYLRLYRSIPYGRFAIIAPTVEVLSESAQTLAEQLGFLRQLGLVPCLCLGAIDELSASEELGEEAYQQFCHALGEAGFSLREKSVSESEGLSRDELMSLVASTEAKVSEIPIFRFSASSTKFFGQFVALLAPRKLVLLRARGGLGLHDARRIELEEGHFLQGNEAGISVINLRSDFQPLMQSENLEKREQGWLKAAHDIFQQAEAFGAPLASLAVASPFSLLRELFTVRGEGTLIRPGAQIHRYRAYAELNLRQLSELLSESFSKKPQADIYRRVPLAIFLEHQYRGVALLEEGLNAAFLTKFAVLPVARGEGLGQELWWALVRAHPRVYWRSRPDNPINSWYSTVCDGMQRRPEWHVFWRGVAPQEVPALIIDAESRPIDMME
ncbi:MAG: hypothetical protein MK135_06235 [Polyangiaceae bacterium]|nr:hypothetical protein [Polyangiaceae bacterium]